MSAQAPLLPDSMVTDDNVYRYMYSDPEKSEAIMAALRERKKLPEWKLDYIEGDLYLNTGRYNRASGFYTKVLESDRAHEDDALQMDILHRMISCYDHTHNETRRGEYIRLLLEKAEACGDRAMLAVALFNMGKSQYEQDCKEKGYRRMEQAARMMAGTDYKNRYDNLRYHYHMLLTYYVRDRRGEDALRVLDALTAVVGLSSGKEDATIDGLEEKERKALCGHRTVVLNMLGRTDEADACYRRFITLGKPTDRDNYLVMPYLFGRKMYDEIFRISRLREQFLREQGNTVNYHMTTIRKNLGQACYETGDYKGAAQNFGMLAALRDSIKNREQRSAALELAEVYESGEKDKQIQTEQDEKRLLIAFVVAVIIALGIMVYYNRRIRRRNVSLVRAVTEGLACKEQLLRKEEECLTHKARIETLEKRLEELGHTTDKAGAPDKNEDAEASEKEQLKQALHEIAVRRLYLQPGITPKALQEELHVPAYLFGAFLKQQTGRNFSEHINRLRMDYAAGLLIEHPQYPIDVIAKMCGIDSRQHFHRLFSEYLGITPSAFRKSRATPDSRGIPDEGQV